MSKVFVSMSMSLDGYIEPPGGPEALMGEQWMKLQGWIFPQQAFRELLGLGDGGETGGDNQLVEATLGRTGTTIIGKRMFDAGERLWPEEAPFRTPVFVLTHTVREPWVRPGGTTFHFVNDGIHAALARAREVAGGRDLRIGGGADVVQQYLNAGVVDELHLAVAPVLFGGGRRLFVGVDTSRFELELREPLPSPHTTHLRYAVRASR
jgi:dihydrofolate reductase